MVLFFLCNIRLIFFVFYLNNTIFLLILRKFTETVPEAAGTGLF